MQITNELINDVNSGWYRVKILPEIQRQAQMVGVRVFEPTDARIIRIRSAIQSDWEFLIPFWWGKYEVHIHQFDYVIEVAYENHGQIYHYPSNTVEIYK